MNWGDSDDETSTEHEFIKSYLLIILDTDKSMFEYNESLNGPTFDTTLKSCYDVFDALLMKMGRTKNQIAIMTTNEDEETSVLCDFTDPLPASLKMLRGLCDLKSEDLKEKFCRNGSLNVANLLLKCKTQFKPFPDKDIKVMAYVTQQDDLSASNDAKFHAVNQARTFSDFNIRMELLTFNSDFNYKLYFNEILLAAKSNFNYEYLLNANGFKDKLLSLIRYRGNNVKLYIFPDEAENKYLPAVQKKYIKPAKILANLDVTQDTYEEVKVIHKGVNNLDKYQIKYGTDFIELTANERKLMIPKDVPVGYKLLSTGSKLLELGLHISDPVFIQSSSKYSKHFDIFWQYCVDKNKVLFCTKKTRKEGPVRLVEMSPRMINGIKSFLILTFPYLSEVNWRPETSQVKKELTEEQYQSAADLINAASFDYNPLEFHNTAFCKKREYVRSGLLMEPARPVEDITETRVISNDLQSVIANFKELCYENILGKGTKRKAGSGKSTTEKKTCKK